MRSRARARAPVHVRLRRDQVPSPGRGVVVQRRGWSEVLENYRCRQTQMCSVCFCFQGPDTDNRRD